MKHYSIGEFSELIGKSQQTLRLWDKKNIFIPNNIRWNKILFTWAIFRLFKVKKRPQS